jgi:ATP/maltotriose-dependent transcriptional regulator MalT
LLVNRSEELATLAGHAEILEAGQGCTVVISGVAGQGSSALLHHWVADQTDVEVLEVRGIESEIDLPFAGLAALLKPVLSLVDELVDPQRAALRAALALGPVTGHDRFTVFVAVVSLLARAARNRPLVLAVDDAHHLDSSTLDALAFASRRLGDDAVMIVLAGRTDALALASFAHATTIDLPALALDDARAVLQHTTGSPIHPAVSQRLVEAASGNPSVLIALVAMLNPDQLRGRLPLDDPLPVGPRFEVEVARQLAGLPPETRRALLVVAVGAADQPAEVERALAGEGCGTDALVPAERIGFVDVDGRYRLRDSLVRAAVYHGSAAPDRRLAHRALADVVDPGSMRRAVHLDAACVGTDEAIATALELTAVDAGGRGDTASSWHLWERAARRTPGTADRNRRLLGAAEAALRAGSPDAAQRLLADVEPHVRDQDRDRWDLLRARLLVVTGRPEAAAEVLNDRAAQLKRDDPVQAGALLLEAVPALLRNGRIGTALTLARRAADLVEPCAGVVEARSAVALGAALAAAGDTEASRLLLERHRDVVAHEGWAAAAPFLADTIALAHIRSGDFERASTILDHLAHAIGEASAPHSVPGVLAMQGFLDYRTGRLAEAAAESSQAVQFADETGQPGLVAFPLGTLATVEAMRGDEASCRSAAERLLKLGENQEGGRGHDTIARSALGLLELGLGRPDRAVAELEPLSRVRSRPSVLMWEVDLADALIRTGRIDDARTVIAALEAAAAVSDDGRAGAAVARLSALVGPPAEREAALEQAVTRSRELGLPFGLARSLLDHGGWLRRQRQRKAARASLQQALTRFEAMGATSWATLAAAELTLCTGAARPVPVEVDPLTPQERQVATLVASGCSNREVSARLFVSVRTVESHLSRIYRKLGLRSRSELARSID